MSEDDFFTESWVIKFLGVTKKTLANWRCDGTGPLFIGKGTIRRYPKKEFWEWYTGKKRAS